MAARVKHRLTSAGICPKTATDALPVVSAPATKGAAAAPPAQVWDHQWRIPVHFGAARPTGYSVSSIRRSTIAISRPVQLGRVAR